MLNETPSNATGGESVPGASDSDENPGTESNDSNAALSSLPDLVRRNSAPTSNSEPVPNASQRSASSELSSIPGIEEDFADLRSSFVSR